MVGQTNLKQLAYTIQQAQLVIGGDTGPVHLAAGLKVPTIMLMGPTNATRNGPYGQLANAIEADRACKHCWKRACPDNKDCLNAIAAVQVMAKAEEILL